MNIKNQHKPWIDLWQNNQITFHQKDVNEYLKKYFNIFTNKENCVLVPFCGKSFDMLYLAKGVKNVIGVEVVKSALDSFVSENKLLVNIETRDNFLHYQITDVHKNIELLCGDFFDLDKKYLQDQQSKQIDIFDRASMVALDKLDRIRYSKKILELLDTKAKMLLVVLHYDESQKKGPPHSVSDEEIHKLYGGTCDIKLLETLNLKQISDRYDDLSYVDESIYLITSR